MAESKTVLVTGSTNGIGLEAAENLLLLGHKVIIASRDAAKVENTVMAFKDRFPSLVFGYALDLSSLENVISFAKKIADEFETVDALVLNAGMASKQLALSPEGFEMTFATNHLGHYLLTELLLSTVKPSRIVVLSSGTHDPESGAGTPPPIADIQEWPNPKEYKGSVVYTTSKLANILYGNYLSRRLDPKCVTVAIYNPGFIGDTGLLRELGMSQPLVKMMININIAFTAWWLNVPNQNSTLKRSSPYLAKLAVDPNLVGTTGKYYSIDHERACSKRALDETQQDELITLTQSLLKSKGIEHPFRYAAV